MSTNSRYKTHRGREFNMSAFVEKNGEQKAVGNVPMNARGDIIDAKGNVKIPTQTISRAVSSLKNNESKSVSLKADDTIKPIQKLQPVDELGPTIVKTRDVISDDGLAVEVEYSDGSMEIISKGSQE